MAKPKDLRDDKIEIGYDPADPGFRALVQAIVLGTYTIFQYDPSDDECKQLYARKTKVAVASLEGVELDAVAKRECRARLKAAEEKMPYIHRHCKGDASETGLVQFAQGVFDLDETRGKFPTHVSTDAKGKANECLIPFSSDIKFNLFIRDMQKSGEAGNDNLTVYMKGAPERILVRCSKILINGQEADFTDELREEVSKANADFGKLGERVLAFARCSLDAGKYDRSSYAFDTKTWKEWGLDPKKTIADYASVEGSFPMHDLTLVGVVSLNDPPRPKVDLSVNKCRSAGIKVIMVTGDQPPTAAAIANKVNIIKHPQKEWNYMVDELKIPEEQALKECTAIVIHGDLLAKRHLAEQDLDDSDPSKGQYLQQWISKHEVVFARTTPSQKLLIVDACQKAGHVVAVTGDGVNDSPAIKKADIGIAMGSGSDVAKNAADMLLLDDNFSSIVNGVEEGRLIFDNLKKSIAYTLSSNIPEILPFIFFILVQVPLPLSTVLILCIDLGTDMVPAISFAYENPELDIMDRVPRNSKRDHLVNSKLICFAYLQIGVIQASAGMYTYFLVLNDYGIRPHTVWGLSILKNPFPHPNDVYDATKTTLEECDADYVAGDKAFKHGYKTYKDNDELLSTDMFDKQYCQFGNSRMLPPINASATTGKFSAKAIDEMRASALPLAWDKTKNARVDARLYYAHHRGAEAWTQCRWDPSLPEEKRAPHFYMHALATEGWDICYSSEALKCAQSGYLVSIVCVQWADLMICKTRNLSLSQQGMVNHFGNFGLFFETALVALLCYVPPLNEALGTRMIAFPHFAVPSFSFFVAIFFYDELRKIWLRNGMKREEGRLKLKGWIV